MKVLITGGNGLLGHHVVSALQERGDRVRVLVLPAEDTTWLDERGVSVRWGDICRPETLAPAMHGVTGVLHLAGMMGVWRPMEHYHAVNVTGTENVCRAALAAGARRIVHVSSWTVYGMALGRPAHEGFPLRPFREPYAVTKAAGDMVVQRMILEDQLPAVIIRPGTFFGPGDHLHFGRMAERLLAGRGVIVGSGENALPFVYERGLKVVNVEVVGDAHPRCLCHRIELFSKVRRHPRHPHPPHRRRPPPSDRSRTWDR